MTEHSADPLRDWKGFYEELRKETPRGAVIIASAFLDAQLRELLAAFLIADSGATEELLGSEDKPDRPLSTFSARTKAAYCLGLISKSESEDLDAIRKIRNKFAHKMHNYTFDAPEIVSWCKSLRLAKMITDAIPDFPNDHGTMFLLGVTQLANWLAIHTLAQQATRRAALKDPELGGVVRA